MSQSFRHRTGFVLASIVFGAPMLGAALLGAGPAAAATTTITFSGTPLLGLNTLACPSTPSQQTLSVSPGMTVDFVNRTGRNATLWAGDSQKTLPDKSFVPVTFVQGPAAVSLQMIPDCALDLGQHAKMTVNVSAPVATSAPTQPAPVHTSVGPTVGGGATGSSGVPHDGDKTATPKPDSTPTSPELAPTPIVTPTDADDPSLDANGNVVTGDNDPFASPPAGDVANPIVGEPVVPRSPRSASGLLTLIATVGVVGVSAAAIRAIIAQRAARAIVA